MVPVSPVRSAKMVRLVESEIAKAKKKEQKSPSVLRSSSGGGTRPPVPALSDDIRDMGGIPPEGPGVQIALIACCILILLQMRRSRAAWCLTADNRLGSGGVGEGPCRVNDNRQGEVRLEEGK